MYTHRQRIRFWSLALKWTYTTLLARSGITLIIINTFLLMEVFYFSHCQKCFALKDHLTLTAVSWSRPWLKITCFIWHKNDLFSDIYVREHVFLFVTDSWAPCFQTSCRNMQPCSFVATIFSKVYFVCPYFLPWKFWISWWVICHRSLKYCTLYTSYSDFEAPSSSVLVLHTIILAILNSLLISAW